MKFTSLELWETYRGGQFPQPHESRNTVSADTFSLVSLCDMLHMYTKIVNLHGKPIYEDASIVFKCD
jgi:hypothetical protein